jgi:hypothetical protein
MMTILICLLNKKYATFATRSIFRGTVVGTLLIGLVSLDSSESPLFWTLMSEFVHHVACAANRE